MKIGILTYHRPHNYGALLQAYSLKNYLVKKDCTVEIIDYWPPYHSAIYKIFYNFSKLKILSKIKKLLFTIIDFFRIYKRRNGYSNFCRKYLGLTRTPLYLNCKPLNGLSFDAVIYGSDQIWRKQNLQLCNGFDDVYFGEYIPVKKKIAYAASMGILDLNEQDKLYIKEKMNNYNFLSVREIELKNIISDLTEKDVQLTLDPVFLLEKNDWLTIVPHKKTRKPYVFFYNLLLDKESVILADKVAASHKYAVLEIPGTNVNSNLWGQRYRQMESPLGFLSLISHASFIVSSSFHAIAFSLIFQKQFFAIGFQKNSGRIQSLLEILGLGHRYLTDSNEINWNDSINYDVVNARLQQNIKKSREYLKHALNFNDV